MTFLLQMGCLQFHLKSICKKILLPQCCIVNNQLCRNYDPLNTPLIVIKPQIPDLFPDHIKPDTVYSGERICKDSQYDSGYRPEQFSSDQKRSQRIEDRLKGIAGRKSDTDSADDAHEGKQSFRHDPV